MRRKVITQLFKLSLVKKEALFKLVTQVSPLVRELVVYVVHTQNILLLPGLPVNGARLHRLRQYANEAANEPRGNSPPFFSE